MDFHPESKRMQLKSLHPGVTLEQVQTETGFELSPPAGAVPETITPTDTELEVLRTEVDPTGMRRGEFV